MERKRICAVPVFREHFLSTFLALSQYARRAGSFDTNHAFLAPETAELRFLFHVPGTHFVPLLNATQLGTVSRRFATDRCFRIFDPSPGSQD